MVLKMLDYWIAGEEDRFDPLFQEAPIMIHSIDADGKIIRVSNYWLEHLGYTENEVIGRKSSDFLTEASRQKAITEVLPQFFETGVCNSVEYEFIHKDKSIVDVSLSAIAEKDVNGKFSRSLAIIFDISEQKAAERMMEAAREEAVRANKAKSKFLAALSHEFRTPLNAISGFSYLAAMGALEEKQKEYIEHIDDAAKQLMSLTNDLLDLAQIDEGRLSVTLVPFALVEFIETLSFRWAPRFGEKNLSFKSSISENLPDTLVSDSVRVNQVLSNFLSNALKFTAAGCVCLSVTAKGRDIIFAVEDTGTGLTDDEIESIFHRFDQGQSEISNPRIGWGLGLSICRELADLLGGEVSVTSNYGAGSKFTLRIPITRE